MKKIHRRAAQIIGLLLTLSGVAIWLASTFRENILFFITPSQFMVLENMHPLKTGRKFRLGGFVLVNSVIKNGADVSFLITDEQKNNIKIHYKGILPELFREEQGIVAEGSFKNNVFEANRLLAKHDERYMPKIVGPKIVEKQPSLSCIN